MERIEHYNDQVNDGVKKWGLQLGLAFAFHPYDYAKTLVQLGYEPFQPIETKRMLAGPPYLALPNMFTYMKYIKSVDGLSGLYRGIVPKLAEVIVGQVTYNVVKNKVPIEPQVESQEQVRIVDANTGRIHQQPSGEAKKLIKSTCWEILCISARAVVTSPLHVVTIRTMAEFVGRETVYSHGLIQSIIEIYKEEGLKGFFTGLMPRILGEAIYIVVTTSIIYVGSKYVTKDQQYGDTICNLTATILAGSLSYPFALVSNVMTVNKSQLMIGNPPYANPYRNWISCWSDLSRLNQLKRGSSMFWRYYQGPTIMINGKIRPLGFFFGPIHMPDEGLGHKIKYT